MKIKNIIINVSLVACLLLLYSSCKKSSNTPTASFTFMGANIAAPATVTFTNTSKNATGYLWSFGDNTTSTQTSPSHTYTAGGAYTVVLKAYAGSDSAQSSQTVTILNPAKNNSLLCNGEATNSSYFPLAVGNEWTYHFNSGSTGDSISYTVVDTTVINTKTYYYVQYYNEKTLGSVARYFREDALGDVYEYTGTTDVLLIPASPTANYDFGMGYDFEQNTTQYDRKVTSITGTITTNSCTYNNCLVIQDQGGGIIEYFVQGLGCVYTTNTQLSAVTLK